VGSEETTGRRVEGHTPDVVAELWAASSDLPITSPRERRAHIAKHALIGNGLIIQFGGRRYTNSGIINRALDSVRRGSFPEHLYPSECAEFVRVLHREHRAVLNGAYDRYAFAGFEKAALEDFKSRYDTTRRYSVDEIGFEDYFLLFELVYNKLGKTNPETFHVRGVLRRMFLDAVFDGGAIQMIHKRFPTGMVDWLSDWNLILTTNYDNNLESVSSTEVLHLHGAFDVLSDVYDPTSFRNQLSEDLLDGEKVDWLYPHLYSSCLLSYVSEMKSFSMTQASQANIAMEKFAAAYRDDPQIRHEIDAWDQSTPLLLRMREAIRLKCEHPELQHSEQYPMERFREISGHLTIIGLSPMNDNHVFDEVAANDGVDAVDFHFYAEDEAAEVAKRLEGKDVTFLNVRDLWTELEMPGA
jgi:hypothetical protein